MRRYQSQRGVYVVEFALVGSLFFVLVLGGIEVSRLMYTWSALDAMTQRGARVAAVCTVNAPLIREVAVFGQAGATSSPIVPGVTPDNIDIDYLDEDGATLDLSDAANLDLIAYVSVGIEGYFHQSLIPNLLVSFIAPGGLASPSFRTIRPRESLGFNPDLGTNTCSN